MPKPSHLRSTTLSDLFPPPEAHWQGSSRENQLLLGPPIPCFRLSHFRQSHGQVGLGSPPRDLLVGGNRENQLLLGPPIPYFRLSHFRGWNSQDGVVSPPRDSLLRGKPGDPVTTGHPLYPVSDLAISEVETTRSDLVSPPRDLLVGGNRENQLLLDTPYTLLRLSHFRG